MAITRRMVFGRINRRNPNQDTFDESRTFYTDMTILADSRLTTFHAPRDNNRPARTWFAGDLMVTPDNDFMTGTLGFTEQQLHISFDSESFSWIKAETEDSDAASEQTVAPFAIDLRNHNRWVAFATTPRIKDSSFRNALEKCLNNAVAELALMPTDWEVDLVTSPGKINEWLRRNPQVYQIERTIKFTNPGKNLDKERAQMRALHANRKTEQFAAYSGRTLDVNASVFQQKLEGTGEGNLEIKLKSRNPEGSGHSEFNSRDSIDTVRVDDFGTDLQRGMESALAELRAYVATLDGPAQQRFE